MIMDFPKNQIEFEGAFPNEEKCLEYLFNIKYPLGYICDKCKTNKFWINNRNNLICKQCKKETSLTAGTIFHGANQPLMILFRCIWWMVAQKNGVSANGLLEILGMKSYSSAWNWLHKFRRIMVLPNREKLSGVVEVDETLVGGKKSGKRGRGAEGKTLIVIAVELKGKGAGRTRLSIIDSASRIQLNEVIRNNIERGSTVITDAWKGYVDVNQMKYKHVIENQTQNLEGEDLLPNVHRIASLLKRWLLGTHQSYLNKGYLEYYLDEFVFRFNRRKSGSRGKLFHTLIYQAMNHEPITFQNLKKIEKT